MLETKLLNALKQEQSAYALQGLMQPNQRDAFEYGHRAGTVAGLEKAINILINLLKEDEDNDSKL